MGGSGKKAVSGRHIPEKPRYVAKVAEPYWDLFTGTYDFEDVEAPRLAMLCNLYAHAEHCQKMSFDNEGAPLVIVGKESLTGDPEDAGQMVGNPFMGELGGIQREIERVSAALGILVREKSPIKSSIETPVDRAVRRRAEKAGANA